MNVSQYFGKELYWQGIIYRHPASCLWGFFLLQPFINRLIGVCVCVCVCDTIFKLGGELCDNCTQSAEDIFHLVIFLQLNYAVFNLLKVSSISIELS